MTTASEPKRYDLLLRGGRVVDPANGRDARLDVAVSGKHIAEVAADIPPEQAARVLEPCGRRRHASATCAPTSTASRSARTAMSRMHADAHLACAGRHHDRGCRQWAAGATSTTSRSGTSTGPRCILAYLNIAGEGMVDESTENAAAIRPGDHGSRRAGVSRTSSATRATRRALLPAALQGREHVSSRSTERAGARAGERRPACHGGDFWPGA